MVPGPAKIGIARGDIEMPSLKLISVWLSMLDSWDLIISKPTKNIRIPPVILKAGIVIPNKSKTYFPKIINPVTIIKAVKVAFREIFFLVCLSACLVRLKKMGIFPAGLLMAKNPVNTAIANNHRFSINIQQLRASQLVLIFLQI